MGNMFEGIEETDREGGSYEKREWFQDGVYVVQVDSFQARESTHPDREGQGMVIFEGQILEVLTAFGDSNPQDEKVVWFNTLERNAKSKLTNNGKRAMGRVKNFAAAALGGVEDSEITAAIVLGLTEADADNQIAPGEALKGIRLIATAKTKIGDKSGKPFTTVTWQPLA